MLLLGQDEYLLAEVLLPGDLLVGYQLVGVLPYGGLWVLRHWTYFGAGSGRVSY